MFLNFLLVIIIYFLFKRIFYLIRQKIEKLEFIGTDCLFTYYKNMKIDEIYFNVNDIDKYLFSKISTTKENGIGIKSITMVIVLKNGTQLTIEKKENVIIIFAMLMKFREKEILELNMNAFSLYLIKDQLIEEIKKIDDSIFDTDLDNDDSK